MRLKTLGLTAASLTAVGAIAVAGSAIASAADDASSSTTPSASASAERDGNRGGQHTAVTGDEADKVIAAVEATDSTVTIETVCKDPDGSYDAVGTKDGQPVVFDVSTDLATITERTGGPGHDGKAPGTSEDGSTTSEDSATTETTSTSV